MRKIASLLLVALILATMLTVFAVTAFAEETPTELLPDNGFIILQTPGNYIISSDCEVDTFALNSYYSKNITVTIAQGVTVTVTYSFVNSCTINVYGTLKISDTARISCNDGTINVLECCGGKIEGTIYHDEVTVFTRNEHFFVDGKCPCGYICSHETEHVKEVVSAEKEICPDCKTILSLKEITSPDDPDAPFDTAFNPPSSTSTATTQALSKGSLAIIIGIAALAIGFGSGFLLGKKKKKPVVSDGSEE